MADARIPLTVCPISNVVNANVIDDADTVEDIAFDASWAPVEEKSALRDRFVAAMATLREEHGLAPRLT